MTQKNETVVIGLFLITVGILGGGYWWFTQKSGGNFSNIRLGTVTSTGNQPITSNSSLPPPPSPQGGSSFTSPDTIPADTRVKIDGSTSMVLINQALKYSFETQFPGTKVITDAKGSDKGIQALLGGNIDVAALSRPLTPHEQEQGLVAIPVTQDAIAIVIGQRNPLSQGLTQEQVVGIFEGKIRDWSELGRSPGTIQVINRPQISGTRQMLHELVLKGGQFGNTPNIMTMKRDATTPILQKLGVNGISYATYPQVVNQKTVRTLNINGLTPEASNYPYQRSLFYVYKNPPSEAVKAFLGYTTSPMGQQVIVDTNSTKE